MTTTKCCMTPIYGWQRPCVRSPNHRSVCFQGKIKPDQFFYKYNMLVLMWSWNWQSTKNWKKPSQRHPERSAEDRVSCLTPAQLVKSISAQDLQRKHCWNHLEIIQEHLVHIGGDEDVIFLQCVIVFCPFPYPRHSNVSLQLFGEPVFCHIWVLT